MMLFSTQRERARTLATRTTKPTMTDQSGQNDADINTIVKTYAVTGQAPGAQRQGFYADLTQIPRDLKEMIDLAKDMETHRRKLPEKLQTLELDDLLYMTSAEIMEIMKPPEEKPPAKENSGT